MANVFRDADAEREDQAWLRWGDVRMPHTESEAHAAIDLASTKVANLETLIAERPDRAESVAYALRKWGEKLAELEWSLERLRAGEAPPSIDLARERARFAEAESSLRAQIDAMETRRRAAERAPRPPSETSVSGYQQQIRQLTSAIHDRDATIERLKSATPKPVVDPAEARRKYAERQHELGAMALEAIDDMTANGARHTSLSRMIADLLTSSLPAGYREKWRVAKRWRLDDAAAVQPQND